MSTPTNGYDILKCNLCSFKSGHEDSIKEHFIDHLNCTKEREEKNLKKEQKKKDKNLLYEYDVDGNFIGYISSEAETEDDS